MYAQYPKPLDPRKNNTTRINGISSAFITPCWSSLFILLMVPGQMHHSNLINIKATDDISVVHMSWAVLLVIVKVEAVFFRRHILSGNLESEAYELDRLMLILSNFFIQLLHKWVK